MCARVTESADWLLLPGIAAAAALVLVPGALFYFDVTPKVAVILVGAAAVLVRCAAAGSFAAPHREAVLVRWFGGLLALGVVSLAASSVASPDPWLSVIGTGWRRLGLVTQAGLAVLAWLAACHCAGRPERVRAALRVFATAACVTAAYAIAQYFGVDPLLPPASYHVGEGEWQIVRPPSTLGYVSYFAAWQVFGAGCAVAALALETDGRWRRFDQAAALLGSVGIVLSGTRAGMLALGVAALAGVLWARPRLPRRALAGAALLCLAGTLFYFSPAGQKLRSRTRWFGEDRTGGARPALWRDSLAMARTRWLTGWGPETFAKVFPHYQSKELSRAYPDFTHESPHNIFLDALVAQGVAGLVALAGIGWVTYAAAWRVRRVNPALGGALAALMTGCMVVNFFIVFTSVTALGFLYAAALTVALASQESAIRPFIRAGRAGAAVAAIAFAALGLRLLAADAMLAAARTRLLAGDLAGSMERFEAYRRWNTPGSAADLWFARTLISRLESAADPLTRLESAAAAGTAALRATRTSENPADAWYTLAAFYALQDDARRSEECLRAAIAASPNWFKPHWVLARLLERQGRAAEAAREAATAVDLDGGKHPEVKASTESIRRSTLQPQFNE